MLFVTGRACGDLGRGEGPTWLGVLGGVALGSSWTARAEAGAEGSSPPGSSRSRVETGTELWGGRHTVRGEGLPGCEPAASWGPPGWRRAVPGLRGQGRVLGRHEASRWRRGGEGERWPKDGDGSALSGASGPRGSRACQRRGVACRTRVPGDELRRKNPSARGEGRHSRPDGEPQGQGGASGSGGATRKGHSRAQPWPRPPRGHFLGQSPLPAWRHLGGLSSEPSASLPPPAIGHVTPQKPANRRPAWPPRGELRGQVSTGASKPALGLNSC